MDKSQTHELIISCQLVDGRHRGSQLQLVQALISYQDNSARQDLQGELISASAFPDAVSLCNADKSYKKVTGATWEEYLDDWRSLAIGSRADWPE